MCGALKEIYREVYQEPFDFENFSNRKQLQVAVYLLENMGVNIGDYSFSWNKNGPSSLSLDCDAQKAAEIAEKEFTFSKFARDCFAKVREYSLETGSYQCAEWMECIASLHYIKNVYKIRPGKLLVELETRKPYLSDSETNLKALKIVKEMSA